MMVRLKWSDIEELLVVITADVQVAEDLFNTDGKSEIGDWEKDGVRMR
jgi:hypothetical protein